MDAVYHIWLNTKEKISSRVKCELLEHFGNAERIYNADKYELSECLFLTNKDIKELENKNLGPSRKEYERAKEFGAKFILYKTPEYPLALLNIPDPPILLYAVGDTSLLQNELAFCIVGSRHATQYGITAAMQISSQIAECGVTVISGCANGIDSAAHKGALRAGGKTIGVAGCGINVDYPKGNEALRKEMAEKGLIISEFPLSTPPYSYNFPIRNRILSGLSLGVAVIEAGLRSGALNTARHAWEQNKDVFALPGNITNKNSGGTNSLIADGASVILGADTILGEYIMRYPNLFEIEKVLHDEASGTDEDTVKVANAFDDDETDNDIRVLKMLKKSDMHIDDIANVLGIMASEANALMTMLQIKGLVTEKAGRIYSAK